VSPADSGSPQATRSRERLHVPSSAPEPGLQDPGPRVPGPLAVPIPLSVPLVRPDNGLRRPVSVPLVRPDNGRPSPASVLPVQLPSAPLRVDPAL
jgi:hypothetical protein